MHDLAGAHALILTFRSVAVTACAVVMELPDAGVFPLTLGLAYVGVTRLALVGDVLCVTTINDFGLLASQDASAVTYR